MPNPASYFADGESFSLDKLSPMKFEPRAKSTATPVPKPAATPVPVAPPKPRKEIIVPNPKHIKKPNPNWAKEASPAMKAFSRGATGRE